VSRPSAGAALLALALAVACDSVDAPNDPAWGRQPCAHCGMVVGDPRTAAELVTGDGRRIYFDDVGCMIAYERDLGAPPRHMWAHDADAPRWLDAERATYRGGEATPMDFGYSAHDSGPGLTFAQVREAVVVVLEQTGGRRGVP
jgi:copper chaperone NosL